MEQLAVPAGGDAQAGRGNPRPAGLAAPPAAFGAVAVGWPATARRDRLGAHRPSARCWCSTSRRRRSIRPRPKTCSPRSPGWCTISASPSCSPSTGSNVSSNTPTWSCRLHATGQSPPATREMIDGRQRRRPARRAARPGCRLGTAAAVGARRPTACRRAARSTRWRSCQPPAHHRCQLATDCYAHAAWSCATATSSRSPASTSTSTPARSLARRWAATDPARSSLLWALQGSGRTRRWLRRPSMPDGSTLPVGQRTTARVAVGLVPAVARRSAVSSTSRRRNANSPIARAGRRREHADHLLDRIVPGIADDRIRATFRRASGWRWRSPCQLCPRPAVLLLDEPTRGLDERRQGIVSPVDRRPRATRSRRSSWPRTMSNSSPSVADRVVVLADGEIVADGPTADVVVSSPVFAPQVAKVMRPERWLTVAQITAARRRNRCDGLGPSASTSERTRGSCWRSARWRDWPCSCGRC